MLQPSLANWRYSKPDPQTVTKNYSFPMPSLPPLSEPQLKSSKYPILIMLENSKQRVKSC